MNLVFANNRYEWVGGYETRHLPKAASFRWDPNARMWWTDRVENAAKLAEYAEGVVADLLKGKKLERENALAASRATYNEQDRYRSENDRKD